MMSKQNQYNFGNRHSGSFNQVKKKVDRLIKSDEALDYKIKVLQDMLEYHSEATYDGSWDSVEYILVVLEALEAGA